MNKIEIQNDAMHEALSVAGSLGLDLDDVRTLIPELFQKSLPSGREEFTLGLRITVF